MVSPELQRIYEHTLFVYEKNAKAWDKQRSRQLMEKFWLDRFVERLNPKGAVLDAGCGSGEPIAKYLIEQNLQVTGIDASASMIDICMQRFPQYFWMVMDMRTLALKQTFEGIIAWDSFFHLSQEEQRRTLALFFKHLKPCSTLLMTIGHEAGEVTGQVNGECIYHASLSQKEYRAILIENGFEDIEIVIKDKHCGLHTVLLASRKENP